MNVRELLRYEIWSKRMTRKIFVVFGIVVAGFAVWVAVNRYWLTPGEGRLGRTALAQIDALQNFDSISPEEFAVRSQQAQSTIDAMQRRRWTWRDKRVAAGLSYYLDSTKMDQDDAQREKLIEQKFPGRFQRDPEMARETTTEGERARALFRYELHSALD